MHAPRLRKLFHSQLLQSLFFALESFCFVTLQLFETLSRLLELAPFLGEQLTLLGEIPPLLLFEAPSYLSRD